jgi:hypothetical protein
MTLNVLLCSRSSIKAQSRNLAYLLSVIMLKVVMLSVAAPTISTKINQTLTKANLN